MEEMKPLLQMVGITKSFPGVRALKGVNLNAYAGKVTALLGENGAGKSTLVKIISGVYTSDEGKIFIDGNEAAIHSIKDAQKLGVSIIHQELSLLQNLTVWENMFLGSEKYNWLTRKLNKKEMKEKSRRLLKDIGYSINPEALVKSLTVGEMQMIEIVKAISKNARIIIMDEPTTALTDVETKKLFSVIKKLKSAGIAIIYISHRLEEIFDICDRIMVLRDGMFIGEESVSNITKEQLIAMMVGRKLEEQYPHINVETGKVLMKVDKLSMGYKIHHVSFEVKEGEILGFAGLMGSGRTEVAKLIYGEYRKTSGEVYVDGSRVNISSPGDAIKHGIAYLPEDRKKEGIVLKLPVGNNMTISNLRKYERIGKIDRKSEKEDVKSYINKLSVKTTGYDQIIRNLSGGNQQKVILAKWIMLSPKVLIIDEPTRGIDVGAKKEIYEILNGLKKAGKAIIIISSDMEEILGISDRIIVMHEGTITGELKREEANQEKIMKYAIGLKEKGEGIE